MVINSKFNKSKKDKEMKKIFYILASAIVALGAVACENDGLDNIGLEVNGDTVSFIASIDNTRTDLKFDDEKNIWNTVWDDNDTISITWTDANGERTDIFSNNGTGNKNKFTCKAEGLSAIQNAEVVATYSHEGCGTINSAEGTQGALLEYKGSFTELAKGTKGFAVQNAFLKFTVAGNTAVAITDNGTGLFSGELSNFSAGEHYVAIKANAKDVVEEEMVKYTFKYTAGEFEKETTTFAPVAGTIYNLYYIGEPQKAYLNANVWNADDAWFAAYFFNKTPNAVNTRAFAEYTWVKMTDVEGFGVYECEVPYGYNSVIFCRMNPAKTDLDFANAWNQTVDLTINVAADDYENTNTYTVTSWDNQMENTPTGGNWGDKPAAPTYGVTGSFQEWKPENAVNMELVSDGWYVAKGIELYKDDAFKIVQDNSWAVSYGASGDKAIVITLDTPTKLVTNGKDMIPATNGKFDIYFSVKTHEIKYTCVEEYSSLTVNITIDNQAKWNPVFITLKSGNTEIASKVTVSNNTYAVSGAYIGEGLTYELTTSSNAAAVTGDVTITKNGATIVLPEQKAEEPVKNMLYLDATFWDPNSARFAAYFFGNGEKWVSMTAVSGKSGIYEVEVPAGFEKKNVIFCRMNKSASANNWNNKWNQTGDLSVNGNIGKIFKVSQWDKQTTGWSAYN